MADATGEPAPKSKFPTASYFLLADLVGRATGKYCVKSVRNLYLRNKLHFTTDEAVSINHGVDMATNFFMPLGALTATSITNRYNIIIVGTCLYEISRLTIFLGSLPKLRMLIFMYLFWTFEAIPAVIMSGAHNSLGGDQFKIPGQEDALKRYYSVLYVINNITSLGAFYLIPLLKTEVACFGEQDCYPLAFGLSVLFTFFELVVLLIGNKYFVKKKSTQGILYKFFMCIGNGVKMWARERKTNPRPHWMDHAEPAYGAELVSDIKRFFGILIMLIPLPIFWGVYNQMDSKWLFQATRMDGRVGSYTIIPDHYQLLNPLLVLLLVPIVNKVIDPLTKKFGMERVLRRLVTGGLLVALSFVVSGFLESKMRQTYPVMPNPDECEIRLFNSLNCSINIKAPDLDKVNIEVYPMGIYTKKHIPIGESKEISISGKGSCATLDEASVTLEGGSPTTIFIQEKDGEAGIIDYKETIDKSETGFPLISVIGPDISDTVILEDSRGVKLVMESEDENKPRLEEVVPQTYKLTVKDVVVLENFAMHLGGVYTIMVTDGSANIYEIIEPNSVHILWIIIQTTILTLGEIYIAVSLPQFLYTEAPPSLVQVASAAEMFADGIGSGAIVVLTSFGIEQVYEFYLSALILTLDMVFMTFLAMRYKPIDPNTKLI